MTSALAVAQVREAELPLLVDGSGLNLVAAEPDLVRGYRRAVLTPNINEFGRLAKAVGVKLDGPMSSAWQKHTAELAAGARCLGPR